MHYSYTVQHLPSVHCGLCAPCVLSVWHRFYLLYPLLVSLVYQVTKRGLLLPSSVTPPTLFGACFLLSLVISAVLSFSPQLGIAAFYLLPSRFWQLLAGGMLHHYHHSRRRRAHRTHEVSRAPTASAEAGAEARGHPTASRLHLASILVSELAVVGLLAGAFALTDLTFHFPFPNSLPAVLGAVGFISLGTCPQTRYTSWLPAPLTRSSSRGGKARSLAENGVPYTNR